MKIEKKDYGYPVWVVEEVFENWIRGSNIRTS